MCDIWGITILHGIANDTGVMPEPRLINLIPLATRSGQWSFQDLSCLVCFHGKFFKHEHLRLSPLQCISDGSLEGS